MTTMPDDDFVAATPSSSGVDLSTLMGALVIYNVKGFEEHVPTAHTQAGEVSPAVRADLHVVDGPRAGDEYLDILVFPKVLQSRLKTNVGKKVIGRITQGEKKAGKNAAWMLAVPTPADVDAARRFWQTRSAAATSAPASSSSASPLPPF